MSNQTSQELVTPILQKELGVHPQNIKDLTTGYTGQVYAVTVDQADSTRELAVKIINTEPESSFDQEDVNHRVYGSRWSNLKPSHDLLTSNNIKTYNLYALGELPNEGVSYSVMQILAGKSVREFLAYETHVDMYKLHALTGETLGKMHRITRGFQGWINMPRPYAKSWRDAWFESLNFRLIQAAEKSAFVKGHSNHIQNFIHKKEQEWIDPQHFVFSHTDGFQGMADYKNGEWVLTGVVDVEDNQFTDQRFVLAGHELALEYERRAVPKSFWREYNKYTKVDDSYQTLKPLFTLYYLLSWLRNVAYDDFRGLPEEQNQTIRHFERLISEVSKL